MLFQQIRDDTVAIIRNNSPQRYLQLVCLYLMKCEVRSDFPRLTAPPIEVRLLLL